MLKFIVLFAVFACVAAFAPVGRVSSQSTVMMAKSKSTPWTEAPVHLEGLAGYKEFDPIGFSTFFPAKWMLEAEIKHARVAMLGVLGYVAVDLGLGGPGKTAAAAHDISVSSGSMFQIFLAISALEFIGIVALRETLNGNRAPGDFGFDPLSLAGKDKSLAEKEISNGRLAMLAFSGIVTQAVMSGKGFPYY